MAEKIDVLGLGFDNLNLGEFVDRALAFVRGDKKGYVITPNAEISYLCGEDVALRSIVNGAELVLPDGAGVVLAARLLKKPLKGKVAGIDFAAALMEKGAKMGASFYFLGSKPGVAEKAKAALTAQYPDLCVKGCHHGYFKDDSEAIAAINSVGGVDFAFVCLGAPRQELFISQNIGKIDAKMLCGFGGAMDVFAGEVKRAPDFFVKMNLEWFYRLMKQPQRLGRMMSIPKYLWKAVNYREKS